MNQKIVKAFRKTARKLATQELIYGTLRNSTTFVRVPVDPMEPASDNGAENMLAKEPQYAFHQGTVVVNKESARGIYKALKKMYRKSK